MPIRYVPPHVPNELPDYLRMLRRRADASQREMAAKARVDPSTISGLESGRLSDPKLSTLSRLVRAADCTLVVVDTRGRVLLPYWDSAARDRAGRTLPPHLDVRKWVPMFEWMEPLHGPYTFTRNREERDRKRRAPITDP